MPTTPNPEEFTAAVKAQLDPVKNQFNYEQMLHTFLSVDRFRAWAQLVADYHPVEGARFLSSGCGYAGSLLAYHDAGAAEVTGVEVDPEYVDMGKLRVKTLANAEVFRTDGGPLPFDDGAFDIIESMDVIEHTDDPDAYLSELTRVLAHDGAILLVTPNRLWPVEQHLGFAGPPWLHVKAADRLFGAMSRMPGMPDDRAFKYRKLAGMRTQNISMRTLRRLAQRHGLFLQVPPASQHADRWPLPRHSAWLERMAAHRFGSLVAPVRTLVAVLTRPS